MNPNPLGQNQTPANFPNDEWLNLSEAAVRARVHPVTLRREIATGRLQAVRVAGRKNWRLKASWLEHWLLVPPKSGEAAAGDFTAYPAEGR